MATSISCESPIHSFQTKELANKGNSPVELNRLRSLLKKKVGGDSNVSSEKAGTPRKEIKVKSGATLKLCKSCEHHNKDLRAILSINAKAVIGNEETAKKKRATKKDSEAKGQDQKSNPTDVTKSVVEKKTVVKKPKDRKKKAITQEEKLDGPSASGTVQSEEKSKLKGQRKKVGTTVQYDKLAKSSVDKGKEAKIKSKDIIMVKVPQPRKTAKKPPQESEKAPLVKMNSLVNAIEQGEGMQSTATSSLKSNQNTMEILGETPGNLIGSQVVQETESVSKSKTKAATKSLVSRPKKIAKNIPAENEKQPFENMDVTDLVTFIRGREEMKSADGKSVIITKAQPTKTNKVSKANLKKKVTADQSTLASVGKTPDDLIGSQVVKKAASTNKSKTKDVSKSTVSRSKMTAVNVPADNKNQPFKNMNVTDLVNSIQQGEENAERSDVSIQDKSRKIANVRINNIVENGIPKCHSSNPIRSPTNSLDTEFIDNFEDMFSNDSLTTNRQRMKTLNFGSSEKTALNNESKLKEYEASSSKQSSTMAYCTQGDISHPIDTLLTPAAELNPYGEALFDINFNDVMLTEKIAGTSTGEKINLSTSTNLSRDDIIMGNSMDLSREIHVAEGNKNSKDDASAVSTSNIDIHGDETFFGGNISNATVDKVANDSYVSLRTKRKIKNKTNTTTNTDRTQENISDGIICFTQKDSSNDAKQNLLNQNDKNQQSSATDIEHLVRVKSETTNGVHVSSSQSFSKHNSTAPSGSDKTTKKLQKQASAESKSKAAEKLKSTSDTSGVEKPKKKILKKSKKDSAIEQPKEVSQKAADKSLKNCEASMKTARKNDKTLCDKHENSKKCNEKNAHPSAKERKANKKLKNDMKVANAMEAMSKHFARISIGPSIGTIQNLHIGKLLSESDSSTDECPSDCSCNDYTSEDISGCISNSSSDCCMSCLSLMKHSDSSDSSNSSSSDSESNEDSSSSDSSSSARSSSSSSSSVDENRRPLKKNVNKQKKNAKPGYKEKLNKFCSKYDLRSNEQRYNLRSKN